MKKIIILLIIILTFSCNKSKVSISTNVYFWTQDKGLWTLVIDEVGGHSIFSDYLKENGTQATPSCGDYRFTNTYLSPGVHTYYIRKYEGSIIYRSSMQEIIIEEGCNLIECKYIP